MKIFFSALALILVLVVVFYQRNNRTPVDYLIPNKYVGWVRIEFKQKGMSQLKKVSKRLVIKIPPSGLLKTSSKMESGTASDRFFYYDGNGKLKKLESGCGYSCGMMIWGGRNESHGGSEMFFVGSEQDANKFAFKEEPKVGPISQSN